jgi:predicted nucleic acid-binding protein
VDASALVEYLLQTDRAARIEAVLQAAEIDLHTPALCDVEVAAAVRRGLLTRRLTAMRAAHAVEDYLDLPLSRHGHQSLLGRVLQLRSNFSAYDAAYVALAEQLKGELLTADEALARAVRSQLALRLASP